jgi:hypothetical protein
VPIRPILARPSRRHDTSVGNCLRAKPFAFRGQRTLGCAANGSPPRNTR